MKDALAYAAPLVYPYAYEEMNPREKPQNGTQENPEKPSRRRKGESPEKGITTTEPSL